MTSPASDERAAELAGGLRAVRERVERACAAAGRDPAELTLVVVTKTRPASDVLALARLGVRNVGESRHPEGGRKAADCAEAGATDLTWHFVGAVQTNKAGAIARYADWVHAVDRPRLVDALDRGAVRAGRVVQCLVQVSLDPPGRDEGRSGAAVADVAALAAALAGSEALRLRGVMAVAPMGEDPAPAFARLRAVADEVVITHPEADVVSAGMSGDLEQAVMAGATHLRVGRAILGERPSNG